jgi:hypothetical protein
MSRYSNKNSSFVTMHPTNFPSLLQCEMFSCAAGGILSVNPEENQFWWNANHVYVSSCLWERGIRWTVWLLGHEQKWLCNQYSYFDMRETNAANFSKTNKQTNEHVGSSGNASVICFILQCSQYLLDRLCGLVVSFWLQIQRYRFDSRRFQIF